MLLEVRIVVTFGEDGRAGIGKEHDRGVWGAGNNLFLIWVVVTWYLLYDNSLSYVLNNLCTLHGHMIYFAIRFFK